MPLNYQQQLFSDFSGGITDKYVIPTPNRYKIADNMYITEYDSLTSRGGLDVFYNRLVQARLMGLWELNEEVYTIQGLSLKVLRDGTTVLINVNPVNGGQFLEIMGESVYPNASKWQNQLIFTNSGTRSPREYSRPMMAYRKSLNTYRAIEAGLPQFDTVLTYTPNATGANEYLYAAHYSYEYTVDGIKYRFNSSVKLSNQVTTSATIGAGGSVNITGLPNLIGSSNQVDNANVKIELYRTTQGTSTFYRIAQLAMGTASFNDVTTDANLIGNPQLYINGGGSDHYQAPRCKHMTVVGDIAYYAAVVEELNSGDEYRPYRLVQSIPGSITAIDQSFFRDLDDEIVGVSHTNGYPIVFTKSFIYRIDGVIDSFGNGSMRLKVLSDSYGCASASGIVRTNDGLYWAGDHGFYATDGFKITVLTLELTKSYNELVGTVIQQDRIHGAYDSENERVYWSVSESDSENNLMWVLNVNPIQRGKRPGFTKFRSGGIKPVSTMFFGDDLLIASNEGSIFRHNDRIQTDLLFNATTIPFAWSTKNIDYDFETSVTNFGNPAVRKWVADMTVSFKTETNIAMLPISNNDDERQVRDMKEIRSFGTFYWGDPDFIWGSNEIRWRKPETESKTRHFPRSTMRCRRKQLRLKPATTVVYISDDKTVADVSLINPADPNTNAAVVIQGTYQWPTDVVGYYIRFETDGYVGRYLILARSNDTLTIAAGPTIGVGLKWDIVGKYKKQIFELKSIAYKYAFLDNLGGKFKTGDEGGNE